MKYLLVTIVFFFLNQTSANEENCIEPQEPCSGITEYNAYVTCLDENRRQKRSVGCPLAQTESCEYVDCQSCQETCPPDCPDCECPSSCRQCCSETCSTNLCCHKTCHSQCKTNYCRAECKKECKQRIYEQTGTVVGGHDTDVAVNVIEGKNSTSQSKHNITTIINLHNIINNTNLIDIPIKINNTNYNNITLKRSQSGYTSMTGRYEGGQQEQEVDEKTGEKCCYIVSPRQCVKTNYHPFMRCFQYRHRKCGPFCIATIIHAQNQNYCDDSGCHNKVFYIPQVQPRCYYTPNWPFVNCGGHQTFHNCQGCYDHVSSGTTGSHHHMRCSRCYDDGTGPSLRQGPMYQPPVMSGYPGGYPGGYAGGYAGGYVGGYGGGYPGGLYGGYPAMPPPMPTYPMYGQFGYNNPGYPNPYGQQFYGQQFYNPTLGNTDNEIIDSPKSESYNELNLKQNLNYPVGSYVHETVIPADQLLKSGSTNLSDQTPKTNLTEDSNYGARYALISIDAAEPNYHEKREDKKEKRHKKRRTKHEQVQEKKKDEKSSEEKTSTK